MGRPQRRLKISAALGAPASRRLTVAIILKFPDDFEVSDNLRLKGEFAVNRNCEPAGRRRSQERSNMLRKSG
jgi:hypothetical protein